MKFKVNTELICLILVSIIVLSVLSVYFYSLGFNHERQFLPNFLFPNSLISSNDNDDLRIEKFDVVSTFEGEKVSIPTTIVLPNQWYFEEKNIVDENGKISEFKKYVISDFRKSFVLTIIPKSINKSRSVKSISTEVKITQEIRPRYVADYDVSNSDNFESVSIYRIDIDENEMKYVQKVKSKLYPTDEPEILSEFIVFNHKDGFVDDNSFVWVADISLHFDDSIPKDEKKELEEMANDVISSLRID